MAEQKANSRIDGKAEVSLCWCSLGRAFIPTHQSCYYGNTIQSILLRNNTLGHSQIKRDRDPIIKTKYISGMKLEWCHNNRATSSELIYIIIRTHACCFPDLRHRNNNNNNFFLVPQFHIYQDTIPHKLQWALRRRLKRPQRDLKRLQQQQYWSSSRR